MPKRNPKADRSAALWELGQIEHGQDILVLLDRHLYLTNDQIERVTFRTGTTALGHPRRPRGAPYAANTALRRLHDAGLVGRVPVYLPARSGPGVRPHYVNVLTGSGARQARQAIDARGQIPRWHRHLLPSPWQPIAHGFWIREAYSSLVLAAIRANLVFEAWADDRSLVAEARRGMDPLSVIPDARFRLGDPAGSRRGTYLLEIDLDTAVLASTRPGRRDWSRKVAAYGGLTTRELRRRYESDVPVIILTVTTTETRLQHLLDTTARAGGAGRFWFTTLADLVPAPLSPAERAGHDALAIEHAIAEREQQPLGSIWRVTTSDERRALLDRHRGAAYPSEKASSGPD